MLGLYLVGLLIAFAIFGPLLARHDPDLSDFTLARDAFGAPPGPSRAHWLGTDPLFRDLFARLAYGARLSLLVALAATVMSTAVGAGVGLIAGFSAGTGLSAIDTALMRFVDVLLAVPFLLFVTAIGVAVGRADVGTILLVLGLTSWTGTARIIRVKTLQLLQADFVAAATALGATRLRIARRHVLPNIAGTLIVLATAAVAQMILAEAVLGYLTVGVPPPRPSWGRMLHESEHYLGTRLWLVAAPGFAILLAVLGFNRVGEGLRDALDPRASPSAPPRRVRRIPFDLAVSFVALILVALASPNEVRPPAKGASAAEPQRGGTLHLATTVSVRSLDPALAYDEQSTVIEEELFARLVTWNDDGVITGDLARDVVIGRDGKSYTFTLRDGLRFHDGSSLGAEDVRRSIERTLHPKTPCPAASLYASVAGFDAFRAGETAHLAGVRVIDERTIAVELASADATFLSLMTLPFLAPVCASAGAVAIASSPSPPCGAGPFRLAAWEPDKVLRLVRNEGYYRTGRPYLDAIEWQLGVRPSTQRYKLEDGDIDYSRDLATPDAALFRARPGWAGLWRWAPKQAVYGMFMNTELPPFDRVAVRRAVAYAIDASVLEKVRPDLAATDRMLPESIPGPDRSKPLRRYDPIAALAEMSRAGYAFDPLTGKGGYPHPIDYVTVPDSLDQQVGEVFQQQLRRIGIDVRLKLVTYATYLAEVSRRRTAAMGSVGWRADFPDPSNFFEPTLASQAIHDEGSQNYAFFSNRRLDDVLSRAHVEHDARQRMELYAEAEQIVCDEAPWVPAYESRIFEVWQGTVRGYSPHPILSQRYVDVWLDMPRHGALFAPAAKGPRSLFGLAMRARQP
jgi:ABC-type dipeptide/oligopeptide/nickel transport system permease subunit/ABC-type transport system substrate-binding protein